MLDIITDNLDVWTTAQKNKKAVGRGSSKKQEAYGIKKLRELILELAVRGKLVPQNISDEPASVLLERIAEEKARLIKEGTIKKQKALPEIADDEKLFELPSGWEWGRLGDISNYGMSDKAQPDELENDVWVLELEDVEKVTSRLINKVSYVDRNFKSSKNRFNKGDVIYGKLRPYLDKVIVADEDGVCTTEMIPVSVYSSLIPHYLRLVMKSPYFIRYANDSTHGMNLPRMGTEKARLALIPVIPENEQHRIVAKVDELMALCDQLEQQQSDQSATHQTLVKTLLNGLIESAKTSTNDQQSTADFFNQLIAQHFDTLFTTEQSIDQLKQTILQLAVMGKLVPQDLKDEPANVLLEKIAEEKTRLIKAGKIKKQKALPEIGEDEKPFELPDGWEWARPESFSQKITDGEHFRPPTQDSGVYFLSAKDIRSDGVSLENPLYISEETAKKALERCNPDKGDLLIVSRGATVGRMCTVNIDEVFCLLGSVILIKPVKPLVSNYLTIVMKTPQAFEQLVSASGSTAQPAIYLRDIKKILFPIAPLSEQHRIVKKVNQLLTLCDTLKANLNQAQTTQTQLADAIVKQAVN